LRLRVPRQLGYKSVKYITRLVVTDDLKKTSKRLGKKPDFSYSWFAGIRGDSESNQRSMGQTVAKRV
jgi:DMSO/TMAO reductase YedYZ molybdopterin-dependent catalytic subunit